MNMHDEHLLNELQNLPTDINARIDIRFNYLSVESIEVLVEFLRNHPTASVCVGNNNIGFTEFYNKLVDMNQKVMFEHERLSMGWTRQELSIDVLAAQAMRDNRIIQLSDVVEQLSINQGQLQKKSTRILDELEASRKELEASRKEEKLINERVTTLDNYRRNGDNCLEYCVSDIVDNVMRDHGFLLSGREHKRKIWDKYGSEVAELDGLLVYEHETTLRKVLVIVEAKSNMTRTEYEKVYKTKKVFENAIAEGAREGGAREGVTKYKRQCGDLGVLVDHSVHVAVGSPGMPHDIVDEAKGKGFLVVQRSNDSYVALNGEEWMPDGGCGEGDVCIHEGDLQGSSQSPRVSSLQHH